MSNAAKFRVAYLTVGYPTLSQTFIQREVESLARNGVEITVFPCRQIGLPHEVNNIAVVPLHPLFILSVFGALLRLLFFKPVSLVRSILFLRHYKWRGMENILANLWGVISGLAIASEVRHIDAQLIHGAWATLPATAAAVASSVNGTPFSFGAHAYDIYRFGGDGFLGEKLNAAAFVHTTTQTNVNYLSSIAPKAKIVLARRGLSTMPQATANLFSKEPLKILSVGRLIKKKGFSYQLDAMRVLLNTEVPIELKIVGDGPLKAVLAQKIRELKLTQSVSLTGALSPLEVSRAYRESDIFWFTGIIDDEGDRDGLPNVVPEAMAHGLLVVSSPSPGAMEAVENEVTGLVVDTTSSEELSTATLRLFRDKDLSARLASNAREWVEKHFMAAKNTAIIAEAMKNSAQKVV